MDKAYAQAYSLYKSGEQYWFDGSELSIINAANEDYKISFSEEEAILSSCIEDDTISLNFNGEISVKTITEITAHLFKRFPGIRFDKSKIRQVCDQLFQRARTSNGSRGYILKFLDDDVQVNEEKPINTYNRFNAP